MTSHRDSDHPATRAHADEPAPRDTSAWDQLILTDEDKVDACRAGRWCGGKCAACWTEPDVAFVDDVAVHVPGCMCSVCAMPDTWDYIPASIVARTDAVDEEW